MMPFSVAVDLACALTEQMIDRSRIVQTSCSCSENILKECDEKKIMTVVDDKHRAREIQSM